MGLITGKKLSAILTALMALMTMLSSPAFTIPVSANGAESSVYDEYIWWAQKDPRWSNVPMGGSTVGSVGCLLTSLSIMAVHSGSIDEKALANMGIKSIEEFNPGVLANAYTANDGFTSGGAIKSWLTIQSIIPNIKW